jgi:uncharacterized protein
MAWRVGVTAFGLAAVMAVSACGTGDGGGTSTSSTASSDLQRSGKSKSTAPLAETSPANPNRPPIKNVVPPANSQTATSAAKLAQFSASSPQDLEAPVGFIIGRVAHFWATNFADSRRPWSYPYYQIVRSGEEVSTNCGPAGDPAEFDDANPAFYCGGTFGGAPVTNKPTIYVSSPWLYDHVYNQDGNLADFAVAFAIAHEMGHAVQDELGYFTPQGDLCCNFQTFQTELQADCFAGVWANSAYRENILEAGDPEEAALAAYDLGDYFFWDIGHHGTPAERQNAEVYGYNTGNPGVCGVDLVNLPPQQIGG